ncbi:hypothetical protein [Saccharopolyspora rectivirgula]|jgi:hypothetical protein|uniref:hypothetical protein n=1 Tax=Saccharopolyspora rectivirgula TaxID=28042 RepID=UPI0004135A20|nr:hypothetical protein [Saccharopolyspora rectivirgula]
MELVREDVLTGKLRQLLQLAGTDEDFAVDEFHRLVDTYGCGEMRKALEVVGGAEIDS